jgi:hypothetical protein
VEMPGCEVGDLRSTGSSHTKRDRSTEYSSVVSMVKNTRCVLVRISIETNTHLSTRQGSPIFLICFLGGIFFSL